jgi:hypothetical protein
MAVVSLFPGKQVPAEEGQAFQRVILHGEAGSGIHSHLGEAGFTQLWWTQGAISATLTAVGLDKTTTKGPLQWVLMVGHFILLPRQYLLFLFFF